MKSEISATSSISLEAYLLVRQYQVGGLIAEHGKKKLTGEEARKQVILLGLLFFMHIIVAIAVLIVILALISDFKSFTQKGIPAIFSGVLQNPESFVYIPFFTGIYILALIIHPILTYRNRYPRIIHCAEGLIYQRGGRVIEMRWDEIESISGSMGSGFSDRKKLMFKRWHYCTLNFKGKKYRFGDEIEDTYGLRKTVEREIVRRRIVGYWARIKAGEMVEFGPLGIGLQGIRKGTELVGGEQIGRVHIFGGVVAIVRDGVPQKWPLVGVNQIPNFFLFVALLQMLTAGRVSYGKLDFGDEDPVFKWLRNWLAK